MAGHMHHRRSWLQRNAAAPSTRALLALRLLAVSAAASVLFPAAPAQAQSVSGGAGVYVSFTFGKQLGVGYGLEGHFMGILQGAGECPSEARAGLGGIFQIGGINRSTLRMVGAVQGGGELIGPHSMGVLGELGLAAHVVAKERGVGLHTGVTLDLPFFTNFFARQEWFLDEYSVGNGWRVLPTFGFPFGCIAGR